MIWGWIPTLNLEIESKPTPLEVNRHRHGNAVEIDDHRILVTIDKQKVIVTKDRNLLSFEEIDDGRQGLSNQSVYIASKELYHTDITHDAANGIKCVRADSFTEALGTILIQFTSWIYDDELERRYGLIPSYSDLVVRLGRIDYGLAFIERYKEHLNENSTIPVKEILESYKVYLEKRYNLQSEAYARHVSESSHALNRTMTRTNWTFLAMAYIGTIFGMHTVMTDSGIVQGETVGMATIAMATLPSLAILLAGWLRS